MKGIVVMKLSELLITNNDVILVNKELAKVVGLNESIVLSQIQYWINIKENDPARYEDSFHDGRCWVYNSIQKWNEQFPFWSVDTVKRAFSSLKKKGILITANYNKKSFDKTNWYAIDYEVLDSIETSGIKMHSSIGAKCTNGSSKMHQPIPKTTTNTTNKDYYNVLDTKVSKSNCFTSEEGETCEEGVEDKKENRYIGTHYFMRKLPDIINERLKPLFDEQSDDKDKRKWFCQIVYYFFKKYAERFKEVHPFLSDDAWRKVISDYLNPPDMLDNEDCFDADCYFDFIDRYFVTDFRTIDVDYRISHFMSGEVRNNMFYGAGYY